MFFLKKKIAPEPVRVPTPADSVCIEDIDTQSKFVTLEKQADGIAIIVKATKSEFVDHSIAMTVGLLNRITPKSVLVIIGCDFKLSGEFKFLLNEIFMFCRYNDIPFVFAAEMNATEEDKIEIKKLLTEKL